MDKKEYFKELVRDFFIITALVNVVIYLLGSMFEPEAKFGYEAYLAPMIYAAFSLIPAAVTYSPREQLTAKELIVRKVIQLALIEAVIFIFCIDANALSEKEPLLLLCVGISIAAVYAAVHLISWFTASRKAVVMTKELKAYQCRREEM